ncbi:hypothetical protein MMC13_004899 [Lambiella insularis]|nr:hypothetical protein [Lambiella insularis]
MAHAHPLSDGFYLPAQQSPHTRSKYTSPVTYFHSPQQNEISQHNRRLQLRNAGFRGPTLPARRVSPFTVASPSIQEPFTLARAANDENTPRTAERRILYGEDLPPSPVSILQEINNNSHRKRQSPRPAITTIFQDSTATKGLSNTSTTSWYHESSNTPSPSPRESKKQKMMKLREGSLNEKTLSSIGFKLPKQTRQRRESKTSSRSSSFEATKYIEHLEFELASLSTKIDAITSPTRTKAQSTKLRTLTNETCALREEVSEWEKRFEERVADEIHERSRVETGVKTDIKALQEDTEGKNIKIQELERELESARLRLEDMNSLAATNQSLERRIDVLTELLAQSPTRSGFNGICSTLGSIEPTKPVLRPKSLLMPRMLSSPNRRRYSTSFTAEHTSWHNKKRTSVSTSSISENPEDEVLSPLEMESDIQDLSISAAQSISHVSYTEDTTSQQARSSSSRPTSMMSNSSFNSSWGLPIPPSQCEDPKSTGRPRRMRRFLSGSCSLKPLILPATTTVTPSLPLSAPVCSNDNIPLQDCSNTSIDPAIAFLSRPQESSPFTTPTQRPRRISASRAQKQALDALEGRSSWPMDISDQEIVGFDCAMESYEQDRIFVNGDSSPASHRPQRRSLQKELEQAQRDALERATLSPALGRPSLTPEIQTQQDFTPRSPDAGSSSSPPGLEFSEDAMQAHSQSTPNQHGLKPLELGCGNFVPISTAFHRSAVVPATTFGLFSKLTGLIRSMKQDPLVLAKHIVVGAWIEGSSRLGGLGWWLLGLVFRSRRRKQDSTADPKIVEEDLSKDIDGRVRIAGADKISKAQPLRQSSPSFYDRQTNAPSPRTDDGEVLRDFTTSSCPPFLGLHSEQFIYVRSQCQECVEPPNRRTLRLWLKFSLAIVLAVGLAVKDGPGTLLEGLPPRSKNGDEVAMDTLDHFSRNHHRKSSDGRDERSPVSSRHHAQTTGESQAHSTIGSTDDRDDDFNNGYSGGYYTFAENLGPADFATQS